MGDLFMSLIHTCELNCANPFAYLAELQKHTEELAGTRLRGCHGITSRGGAGRHRGLWVRAIDVLDEGQIGRSLCYTSDSFLRPARVLRTVHTQITATKVLFEGVPARDGARFGARTTMATATDRTTALGAQDRLNKRAKVGWHEYQFVQHSRIITSRLPGDF